MENQNAAKKRKNKLGTRRKGFIIAFLAPTLIAFCVFYLYPIITVFITSFCKWDYTNITSPEFFGWSNLWDNYDYILIDCMPSLGMITINAFACADSILIPVQAAYLPAKGLQQLIKTIGKVRRQINPKLMIEGILLTMVDARTNYAKDITALLVENYGSKVRIFENSIPISVRAAEISAEGVSIYEHDPKGKVAAAYQSLTEEVLGNE